MINLENNPAIEFFERRGEAKGRIKGIEEGRIEGKEEGIEKGKFEVVIKMLQKGFNIKEISDIINMPVEWIENKLNLT